MINEGNGSKTHACLWFYFSFFFFFCIEDLWKWIRGGKRQLIGKEGRDKCEMSLGCKHWESGCEEWPSKTGCRNVCQTLGSTACVSLLLCILFLPLLYRFLSAVSPHGYCPPSALVVRCVLFIRQFSLSIRKSKTSPLCYPVQQGIFASRAAYLCAHLQGCLSCILD